MATIKTYTRRFKKNLDGLTDIAAKELSKRREEVLSLQRDQILFGRDRFGVAFTPGYTDDPYFKSRAQALAYLNMKKRLASAHDSKIKNKDLYPKKGENTPNLQVSGVLFFNDISTTIQGDKITFRGGVLEGELESKYGGVLGLSKESKTILWNKYVRLAILNKFKGV